MISVLNPFREVTMIYVTLRLVMAFLCGGIIGLEREYRRRAAGFRTHILICLGAAITTMTSQYLHYVMNYNTDIARMGAQVVAGVGFIGAGSIIVTRHQRVQGLTTAAGLWTSAIVGLAMGAGFYEGGIVVTGMVLMIEIFLSKIEYYILRKTPEVSIYLEYKDSRSLNRLFALCRDHKVTILGIEVTKTSEQPNSNSCAVITLRLHKYCPTETLTRLVREIDGISSVVEI